MTAATGSAGDAIMPRIGAAIGLSQRGERTAARTSLAQLWAEIGGTGGDPLHRCALAHALADVLDAPAARVAWDTEALSAAQELTDARVAAAGAIGDARSLFASLHLNLADGYRRLGDWARAREQLAAGRRALDALADTGYRQMIADALRRVESELRGAESERHDLPATFHRDR